MSTAAPAGGGQQQTATTPSPSSETYDDRGRAEVDTDMFLTDDEQEAFTSESQADTTQVTQTQETTETEEVVEPTPQDGEQVDPLAGVEPEAQEQPEQTPQQTQQETQEDTPPKVWAGKYNSEQELKNAYIQLGGDPAKYDKPEALEEAYLIRQAEYTRIRQENAAKEALQRERDEEGKPIIAEKDVDEYLQQVNWNEVTNARDIAKVITGAIAHLMPKPKTVDEQQIVQNMQKQAEARAELSTLESEVPRLKVVTDGAGNPIPNPFRDAFAMYVKGLKQSGQYTNLKSAMQSFIQPTQPVVDDQVKQQQTQQQTKQQAATVQPPDAGQNQSTQPKATAEDDILDGILTARKEHIGKFGY